MGKKTYVYIDGFNLFYGCLKGSRYKWLDIQKLCQLYLPQNDIQRIYYFTASVSGTPLDPDKPQRQKAYLRALQTLPTVKIVQGHFINEVLEMPLADGSGMARVKRSKEKRSDVNLATQLIWDAVRQRYEVAVVVSGDSDFITPINLVKTQLNKSVGILDPQREGTPTSPMNRLANFYKPIRDGALGTSQFPEHLEDAQGRFSKPGDWW